MADKDDSFERGKFEGQVLAVLARIEGSIETITLQKNEDHKAFESRFNTTEARVAKLENWRFYLLGAFAAVALLAGTLKDYLVKTIFNV